MPISPVTIYDSFSRDALTGGAWGTSDTGQSWSSYGTVRGGVTDVTWDNNNNYGYLDVPANTSLFYKWHNYDTQNPSIPRQTTSEVLVRMQWAGDASYPTTDTGPILSRHPTRNTWYYASIQGNYAEASIGACIDGYRWEIDRRPVSVVKNTWYWVRFQRHASGLRLKVWREGTAEPASWLINTILWDGSNPPTEGSSGFFARGTATTYQVRVGDYYAYTLEETTPTHAPSDNFTRYQRIGWGNSSSGHFWEGQVAIDPAIRQDFHRAGRWDGFGWIEQEGSTRRKFGVIGPVRSGDQEVYAEFQISNSAQQDAVNVGLNANYTVYNGAAHVSSGYFVFIRAGVADIQIWRRNSDGSDAFLGQYTLPYTIAANTTYYTKVQRIGNVMRAKVWHAGIAEPNFQITATADSTYSSGRLFVEGQPGGTGYCQYRFYEVRAQAPSVDTALPVNSTSMGTLVATSSTDYKIYFIVGYTGDDNGNVNIANVYIKKASQSTWTLASVNAAETSVDRTAKQFSWNVHNLEPATEYDIRVEYSDPDGVAQVAGTNNLLRASTSANSIKLLKTTTDNILSDSMRVRAYYANDVNQNSTANVFQRVTSRQVDVLEDTFNEIDGIYLQNHRVNAVEVWTKHPLTTAERNATLRNQRLRTDSLATADRYLYYVTASAPVNEYDVSADYYMSGTEGTVAILGRMHTTLLTAYGTRYNGSTRSWELVRYDNDTATVLGTYYHEITLSTIYTITLVLRDTYKAVLLDGTEIIRSSDNTITSGHAGYYATGIVSGIAERYPLLDNFQQTYRTPATSWVASNPPTMSVSRLNKYFTRTVIDLVSDTAYEFRIDVTDPDGVVGVSSVYATGMTYGQAVSLKAVGATTQATSAVVDVLYDYDTNENSSINVLYRSSRNTLWQTVNQTAITVERGSTKRFTTTIANLAPATTYEIRVIISDPNGLMEGSVRELSGLFTTKGVITQIRKRTKHYLWKVYTATGQYLGTLENAGDPEYTWQENGGVTDLGLRLNRPIADAVSGRNPLIAHQNRVDVWVLDPASNGLGPNMVQNSECSADFGGWTLGTNWSYSTNGGPDGSSSLYYNQTGNANEYETESIPILTNWSVPLSVSATAKALGGKVRMYVTAFDRNESQIGVSTEQAETVGSEWQELRINYLPPKEAAYLRIIFRNVGAGTMWVDKVGCYPKEALVYRGMIESFTPTVDQNGEYIEIQILGLVSLLSDDYVEFLQYVTMQPQKDVLAGRPNRGPADPATIMKDLVDIARNQNPRCILYYTADSINPTGTIVEYTFRDQQLRAAFDKVRGLCPPDWHYFVDPDGKVNLRGPQHATTHVLKANIHIMNFSVERSIRNLKNYVRVKGRQDEDKSEPDGHGSINYVAFDQASIDKYGKRVLFLRDAQITTPDTAELYGDGRLEEFNREEQRAQCVIPDEKSIQQTDTLLIGYNIEAFRPGDMVQIVDPISGPRNTYWDKFVWDFDSWNSAQGYVPLPTSIPIKEVQIHGAEARIELSERQPSGVSDYGRLARWLSLQNSDND